MLYALCPMPYALDPRAPHVTEKGYIILVFNHLIQSFVV